MAIQQTIICQNGLIAENAYIKIDILTYNNTTKQVEMSVNIFKDKTYTENSKPFADRLYFLFTPDLTNGKTLLEQGYDYLKQNQFNTAVDLLDEGQTV